MAEKKTKPYATFETKEEFDKTLERMFESGREKGFREGKVWILSYLNDLLDDLFTPQEVMEAEKETHQRHIEEWLGKKERRSIKERLELKHLIKEAAKWEP